jgi:Flp pilus assembly secretin CpaC
MTSVAGTQQVQLEVRVAEVSRTAIRELGMNIYNQGHDNFFGNYFNHIIVGFVNVSTKNIFCTRFL